MWYEYQQQVRWWYHWIECFHGCLVMLQAITLVSAFCGPFKSKLMTKRRSQPFAGLHLWGWNKDSPGIEHVRTSCTVPNCSKMYSSTLWDFVAAAKALQIATTSAPMCHSMGIVMCHAKWNSDRVTVLQALAKKRCRFAKFFPPRHLLGLVMSCIILYHNLCHNLYPLEFSSECFQYLSMLMASHCHFHPELCWNPNAHVTKVTW